MSLCHKKHLNGFDIKVKQEVNLVFHYPAITTKFTSSVCAKQPLIGAKKKNPSMHNCVLYDPQMSNSAKHIVQIIFSGYVHAPQRMNPSCIGHSISISLAPPSGQFCAQDI